MIKGNSLSEQVEVQQRYRWKEAIQENTTTWGDSNRRDPHLKGATHGRENRSG